MRVKSFTAYLDLMKFDVCIFVFCVVYGLQNVVVTQLLEDKVCLNQLELGDEFCATFASYPNATETHQILKAADSFKNYQFLINNGSSLLLSFFIGYWLGNYPRYFKLMIVLPFLGGTCMLAILMANTLLIKASGWFLLLAYVPYALSGGLFLIFSTVYTSITWGTPSHLVIVRFAVCEALVKIALITSTYASGELLDMKPWIAGQRKNYAGVFIVSLAINLIGTIMALLMKPSFTFDEQITEKGDSSFGQVIRDVFQLSRIKETLSIFFIKRPNQGRLRLALLLSSGAVCNAALSSEDSIAYQFAQRVYGLTEETYTSILTLVYIPPALGTSLGPSFLKSCFGLSDASIAIVGSFSLSAFFLIRGLILTLRGYLIGFAVGSFSRTSSVAIRALIVSSFKPTESAQIFTLATAFETYFGLGATFMYTSVFSLTIDKQPGAVLILVGALAFYPLLASAWIWYTRPRSIKSNEANDNENRLLIS